MNCVYCFVVYATTRNIAPNFIEMTRKTPNKLNQSYKKQN